MADKLVRSFEALRSHYLHQSTQALNQLPDSNQLSLDVDPVASQKKLKDASLSARERISYCNIVADFLPVQTVRELSEFPRLLSLGMELLFVSCDDPEADVRLVAGECINRITKSLLDSNIGRIQVELYKEIKKNGPSRPLRAALQRFGDAAHLIRANKSRPFIASLLPCLVKIARRDDDAVQEVLGAAVMKLCPVLGSFMLESDVKVLLKTFLINLQSPSAVARRTAASILNAVCLHSRKPQHFYSWLINMLLGSITPLTDTLPTQTILGVLLCFRHIMPHLAQDTIEQFGIHGSFGSKVSSGEKLSNPKEKAVTKKQFLQVYEVTMFCMKHSDHNVVTAALENLYQVLTCRAEQMMEILLSPSGITPSLTSLLANFSDHKLILDSLSASDTGELSSDLQSLSSLSISSDLPQEKLVETPVEPSIAGEAALQEAGQSMTSSLYSDLPSIPAIKVSSAESAPSESQSADMTKSDTGYDDSSFHEGRVLPRTYTDSSLVNIDIGSVPRDERVLSIISGIPEMCDESEMDELLRIGSVTSNEVRAAVERQFNFDAVSCTGVPLLHCVRFMCSFLLSGKPGETLSDSKTRVSVKSLALFCIGAALQLYPEALFARVLPDDISDDRGEAQRTGGSDEQMISDVFLLSSHMDPQIRVAIVSVVGNFIVAALQAARGDYDNWASQVAGNYGCGSVSMVDLIGVLKRVLTDESSVAMKQACVALKHLLHSICWSTYNVHGYDLAWKLLELAHSSYWLIKVEVVEVLQQLDYDLMAVLEKFWISRESSYGLVAKKYVDLQYQVLDSVLLKLLGDEDARVRHAAALACVRIVPNLCSNRNDLDALMGSVLANRDSAPDVQSISMALNYIKENKRVVSNNLSLVVRRVVGELNNSTSKYVIHGCMQALYFLSESYPPSVLPTVWELMPSYGVHHHLQSRPAGGVNPSSGSANKQKPAHTVPISLGIADVAFSLVSSTWMTFDLQAHQEALKLCVHALCGAATPLMKRKADQRAAGSDRSDQDGMAIATSDEFWCGISDPQLSLLADKLLQHISRVLSILTHVIEETNPLATSASKAAGPTKDRSPLPGIATATHSQASQQLASQSTSVSSPAGTSPKKFLFTKSLQRKQESLESSDKTPSKSADTSSSASDGKPSVDVAASPNTNDKSEKKGAFQHLAHFIKLYEVLRGAFRNYQVSAVSRKFDKFDAFAKGVLESFALLLELATFSEVGTCIEEFLEYLKSTVKIEPEATFLVVQQLLKSLFGTNAASQPETFKLATSTKHLTETHGDPTFAHDVGGKPIKDGVSQEGGLYDCLFVHQSQKVSESIKHVPCVDANGAVEYGHRAFSLFKNFRKTLSHHQPAAKVSKDRLASIQSYIRLFEPLVINALKAYTTTSSTELQCQTLHLLGELVRLRVNYSLLDSDQVFIGFVLKQFELIENGQIRNPKLFVPTVFQFLVLLSYECFQPKFTQAKAIIGMPRIMRLCDSVMACGQPATLYAIPALRPVVQDLFVARSQARPDSSKDLETQREVVVSMLLRVLQHPEVLEMLTQVLEGSRLDDDRWMRLSRQIVDTLLPSLAQYKVGLASLDDMNQLCHLLDAVAPSALRPADIILKSMLLIEIPSSPSDTLSLVIMVAALVRVLVVQNSEDIVLSRIKQLDQACIRDVFQLFPNSTCLLLEQKNEQAAVIYLASYLLFVLKKALIDIVSSLSSISAVKRNSLVPVAEYYMMLLSHISAMDSTPLLRGALSRLICQPGNGGVQAEGDSDSLLQTITSMLQPLLGSHPMLFLNWLYLVRHLGVTDMEWWQRHYCDGIRMPSSKDALTGSVDLVATNAVWKWATSVVRKGALFLYCDVMSHAMKGRQSVDVSLVCSLMKTNISDILCTLSEEPVKRLLNVILRHHDLCGLFIQFVSVALASKPTYLEPSFLKKLLQMLEKINLSHSSGLLVLLVSLLPNIRVYGVSRIAETLACRRLEYLQALPEDDRGSELPVNDLQKFVDTCVNVKRYPRLCSLINRILVPNSKDLFHSASSSAEIKRHPLDAAGVNLQDYIITKDWMFQFVKKLCCLPCQSKALAASRTRLLRSLNLIDIELIMEEEGFSDELLEACVTEAISCEQARKSSSSRSGSALTNFRLELLDQFDTGGSSDSENREKILEISKRLIVKRIVATIDEDFIKSVTIESVDYMTFCEGKIWDLASNWNARRSYRSLCICLRSLMQASCYLNEDWQLEASHASKIVECLLVLPQLCLMLITRSEVCVSLLEVCFSTLAMLLHCRPLWASLTSSKHAYLIVKTIDCVYRLVSFLTLRHAERLAGDVTKLAGIDSMKQSMKDDNSPFISACWQVAEMVDGLRTYIGPAYKNGAKISKFLTKSICQTVSGLARLPLVNSYARIPPIVWKFGWLPIPEGPYKTELPPLPVDILKEREVLREFVFRVNQIGWTSRMQFEETWAALLGVLSAPPLFEDTSTEEQIEAAESSCLAVHCITSLLLGTILAPVPGNQAVSQYSVIHRTKDYPFLGSKAGKKLASIRREIEAAYRSENQAVFSSQPSKQVYYPVVPSLLSAKQRKQQLVNGCLMEGKLFIMNLEHSVDSSMIKLGQISASSIRTRLVTSDVQEDTDSDDSDSLIIKVNDRSPAPYHSPEASTKLIDLDIRSCLQFLLELFEQWLSPYAVPKTPLMLKMEAVKSLCLLSDLLLELNHYEWVLGILLEFSQTHPVEDDILIQYLVPTMCKALAVLRLEGNIAERISKQLEIFLRTPHIPLQVSCLVGALYILEAYVHSTNVVLVPILTEFLGKKIPLLAESMGTSGERLVQIVWTTAFHLVENCSPEIQDPQFIPAIIQAALSLLCLPADSLPLSASQLLYRGLERLVVSFTLTRSECDRLSKVAVNCIASGSPEISTSALGLLCTCMYTGKEGEQASGLATSDIIVDAPLTDSRLVVMERINVLLSRIRKGLRAEAQLVASILPRMLLDFLPVQELMNKLISEFVSSQQPRPELIASMFFKVSDALQQQGQELLVRDWVFLCLGSFIQRTPLSMAIWSLTCFFVSASTNPWLKATFPHVITRKGRLEEEDKKIFCMSALDFYSNQNLDQSQKMQFLTTFTLKTSVQSAPYDELITCCNRLSSE